MALDVHVVSHTHWDREWYHPLERFRQRLVALVDELLDDPPGSHESFLLDGQAIVLEDYLAVRPDREEQLAHLLRTDRLEAGPWLVLADELIPSGEALVRNLLAGRRALRRFAAESPPVLYCPDSFGHPAALPAIAAGFGLPLIVLWRGYGGVRWPAGDTVRWASPSGDEVLVYHLPRDGYEFGSHLPTTEQGASERWQHMRGELVSRATTGVMLVTNGADHHARQVGLSDALAALERAGEADGVHRSALRSFAERLVERSANQRLPIVRGELRDSYGYTWTLQGTFATRAHEKRMNARAERVLLREAEPWAALAAVHGTSRRPLLNVAWHTLLEAHPHDTLCGCSIDDVASAMELRVRSATNQAAGVRDDAIAELVGHDPVAARTSRDAWMPIVVVRNAAPYARGGVAVVDVDEFIADVAVGPGSAPAAPEGGAVTARRKPAIPALGAVQVLSRGVRHSLTESPRHYPDNDLVERTQVAVWVPEAPAYGISSYAIGGGEARRGRPAAPVRTDARSMENSFLRVDVSESGIVSLAHGALERAIPSLVELIDEADVGDLYTPAPRARAHRVEFRGVRRVHRGPLRGELALRYAVLDGEEGRRVDAELTIHLILDADAPFVRLRVRGENRRENHRLRLRVNGDVPADVVWADAAFGPVRREPLVVGESDSAMERPPRTAPLHRYVSLFNEAAGFTLFSDGLAEYEATPDGAIAVTLVRAVGELSRNDLPERPGHAGWPVPTPGAQCIGPFEAELGVMLHGSRLATTIDAIERAANEVLLPLVGTTLRSALAVPEPVRGVELVGPGLACSTVKESEDGGWLVLRCVNLRDDEVAGAWRLPFAASEARRARLDETIMSELVLENTDSLAFVAGPREIVTIAVR
ncbi:MAG TPA: glycoside hydrolase family 38 C-terminal domain-containing protein [Gemmatimonadaceae bacterium]|nr:glycoside hydrolase family 38 C-terminal domain-containing protein [Gemmatimonadaceae bacterium]